MLYMATGLISPHKSRYTLDATHFTSMATGHNRFSVVAELISCVPYKIAAPVCVGELFGPDYPTIPSLTVYRVSVLPPPPLTGSDTVQSVVPECIFALCL